MQTDNKRSHPTAMFTSHPFYFVNVISNASFEVECEIVVHVHKNSNKIIRRFGFICQYVVFSLNHWLKNKNWKVDRFALSYDSDRTL